MSSLFFSFNNEFDTAKPTVIKQTGDLRTEGLVQILKGNIN